MTTQTQEHPFITTLNTRFGGLLRGGKHAPDGLACALEAASVARGKEWSDTPGDLPDIRRVNDAFLDDEARTVALTPVVVSLWNWREWPKERKQKFISAIVFRTITEVLPLVLGRWPEHQKACKGAKNLGEARKANAAAYAAAYATNKHEILNLACKFWREEAEKSA